MRRIPLEDVSHGKFSKILEPSLEFQTSPASRHKMHRRRGFAPASHEWEFIPHILKLHLFIRDYISSSSTSICCVHAIEQTCCREIIERALSASARSRSLRAHRDRIPDRLLLFASIWSMALSLFGRQGHDIRDSLGAGTVWDPFEVFSVLESTPSRQFARNAHAVANTQIDWRETPDAHVFKADLPGLTREEVKVQVVDGKTLEIGGERKKEDVHKGDTWHRVERAQGSFMRRFRLPDNTNVEEIKAQVLDGVLTVTIPKLRKPKPQVRHIDIAWAGYVTEVLCVIYVNQASDLWNVIFMQGWEHVKNRPPRVIHSCNRKREQRSMFYDGKKKWLPHFNRVVLRNFVHGLDLWINLNLPISVSKCVWRGPNQDVCGFLLYCGCLVELSRCLCISHW